MPKIQFIKSEREGMLLCHDKFLIRNTKKIVGPCHVTITTKNNLMIKIISVHQTEKHEKMVIKTVLEDMKSNAKQIVTIQLKFNLKFNKNILSYKFSTGMFIQ